MINNKYIIDLLCALFYVLELQNYIMRLIFREKEPRESKHSMSESENDMDSRSGGAQCYECEGYGHVRSECPTYLRAKGKKAMAASLSDSEGDDSLKGNYMAFPASVTGERNKYVRDSGSESSHSESVDEDSLQVAYAKLFKESLAIKKTNIEVNKRLKAVELEKNEAQAKFEQSLLMVDDLEERNSGLVNRVQILETELEDARTQLSAFSSGNKKVDRMLGILSEPNCNKASSSKAVPVAAKRDLGKKHVECSHVIPPFIPRLISQPQSRGVVGKPRSHPRFVPVCHYCGKAGHIRPKCFMLHKQKKRPKKVSPRFDSSNLASQVSALTKQAKFLSEKLALLSGNSHVEEVPRKVWVRKQVDFPSTSACPDGHDESALRCNSA